MKRTPSSSGADARPEFFEAHFLYAVPLSCRGNPRVQLSLLEARREINPAALQAPGLLIQMYRSLGRDSETKAAARKTLELAERELNLESRRSSTGDRWRSRAAELGEKDRAKEWTTRAQAIEEEDPICVYKSRALMVPGRIRPALTCSNRIIRGATDSSGRLDRKTTPILDWLRHHRATRSSLRC